MTARATRMTRAMATGQAGAWPSRCWTARGRMRPRLERVGVAWRWIEIGEDGGRLAQERWGVKEFILIKFSICSINGCEVFWVGQFAALGRSALDGCPI
jgi:hypothetical protein